MRTAPVAFLLFLFSVLFTGTTFGTPVSLTDQRLSVTSNSVPQDTTVLPKKPKRVIAAALDLTLGPFGVHRLYFGTAVKVPLIYGLTFGGFGVLVVIDLAEILFTKDLGPFMNNDKVFMWSKGESGRSTPP